MKSSMLKSHVSCLAFFAAGLLAALACGCSQRSTLTDGKFVVGFDADFPP